MNTVYIGRYNTFSDAMNYLAFELSVPEYYNPAIPDYFKRTRTASKPIVNGQEVEWEEYLAEHPEFKRDDFIPAMIYKAEDNNQAYATRTPAEMIDMIENNVSFTFLNEEDLGRVIGIYDGYYNEVKNYIAFNPELKQYLTRMSAAREIIMKTYQEAISYHRAHDILHNGPLSLADILAGMHQV